MTHTKKTVTALVAILGTLAVAACTVEREKDVHQVTTIDRTVTHYPDGSSSSSMLSTTREP